MLMLKTKFAKFVMGLMVVSVISLGAVSTVNATEIHPNLDNKAKVATQGEAQEDSSLRPNAAAQFTYNEDGSKILTVTPKSDFRSHHANFHNGAVENPAVVDEATPVVADDATPVVPVVDATSPAVDEATPVVVDATTPVVPVVDATTPAVDVTTPAIVDEATTAAVDDATPVEITKISIYSQLVNTYDKLLNLYEKLLNNFELGTSI